MKSITVLAAYLCVMILVVGCGADKQNPQKTAVSTTNESTSTTVNPLPVQTSDVTPDLSTQEKWDPAKDSGASARFELERPTDADFENFVNTNKNKTIYSLYIRWWKCSSAGFAKLKDLKGLYVLELLSGKTYFKGLTDEMVTEISNIKDLKRIKLWYDFLSDKQKAIIKAKLPECEIVENMNED